MPAKEKSGSINAGLQYAASGVNAITGTLGVAGSLFGESASMATFVNGLHDAGDSLSYWTQGQRIRHGESFNAQRHETYKKIGHWSIFGTSAVAGVKSVYDVGNSIVGNLEVATPSTASVVASLGSLAFAGSLAYASDRKIRQRQARMDDPHRTDAEKDWMKHVLKMDVPSSALAVGGVWAQSFGTPGGTVTEQILGVASAGLGMYLFRPTKENLTHDHASHEPDENGQVAHDHHGHGHEHGHGHGHEGHDHHEPHGHAVGAVAVSHTVEPTVNWRDFMDDDGAYNEQTRRFIAEAEMAALARA